MKQRLAAFGVPAAVCLTLYWPGLLAWFAADDFAWLGLRLSVFDFPTLLDALFAPRAQGTIRPFSDRGYFLLLEWLFGLDALPFRIVAFATQLLNIWLLVRLVGRFSGSVWTGMWAAVFWVVNSSLALAMTWSSTYNELLWPCLLLAGLNCRWQWLERQSRAARRWEWVFFLVGFGVLELQVVYPALALLLTWLHGRPLRREASGQFAVAAAYTVFNRAMAKPAVSAVYALHWDVGMVKTLGTYLRMVTGVWQNSDSQIYAWAAAASWVVLGSALLTTGWLAWRREKWVWFGVGWFLCALGPVLPLRDHISDYYLTVPSIGLGIVAALALVRWPRVAVLPAAVYVAGSAAVAWQGVRYNHDRSMAAKRLVLGVQQAAKLHPGKVILLAGVGPTEYWSAVNDSPFRLLGGVQVYLAPGTEETVPAQEGFGDPRRFILAPRAALNGLTRGQVVVYAVGGERLRNITGFWQTQAAARWKDGLATVVDVGQPLLSDQLEDGWHPVEEGFRWMQGSAGVRLGPTVGARELYFEVFRPTEGMGRGAVTLEIAVNGERIGSWPMAQENTSLEAAAALPAGLDRQQPLRVRLTVTPPLREPGGDGRELGLAFGRIGLR